ncbi:hypothetical protein DB346_09920, partial [Verrucomicrobia bacterium LW23]
MFLLAALSVASVLGMAFAGSFEGDAIDDGFKTSYGLSTNPVSIHNLTGWWQLNASNGASASDRSANDLPLAVATVDGSPVMPGAVAEGGAVWRPGLYDNGFALGTHFLAGQVTGPGATAYALGSDFTFSAWVKPDAAGTAGTPSAATGRVILRWVDSAGHGVQLEVVDGDRLRARFSTTAGVDQIVQGANALERLTEDEWHQVSLVYEAATGRATLYLNRLKLASALVNGSLGNGVAEFRIGGTGWELGAFHGLADEVRLYNRVLSATEIAQLPITLSDLDGDALSTWQEYVSHTDPTKRDSDNNGLPEGAAVELGLDPTNAASASTVTSYGVTQLELYRLGLDAANAQRGGSVAPSHLVGYWPFELNATNAVSALGNPNFVFDHSASALPGRLRANATERAGAFGPGKVGNALVLNGNGVYVEVAPVTSLASTTATSPSPAPTPLPVLSGDFTVGAWVKTTEANGTLLSFVDSNGKGWELGLSNGTVKALVSTVVQADQAVQNLSGNARALADGQWHHIAMTYVASSRTLYLFADGALESLRSIVGTVGAGQELRIGASAGIGTSGGPAWKGGIDEVRLWDVVLSPGEIGTLYAPQVAGGGSGTGFGTTTSGSGTSGAGTSGSGSTSGGGTSGSSTTTTTSTPTEAPVGDRLAAIIKHRPQINGKIDGSVQQLLAEDVTLNSGAIVTGDLLIPGVPQITQNGSPGQITFGGVKTGTGTATPTNHRLTLNSNSTLRYLATRTDAVTLPVAEAPANPTGNRSVNLNGPNDPVGDWATVRDINCNGNTGTLTVPAGTYGNINAGGNWVLKLGVADAPAGSAPALYEFQGLNLNSQDQLEIVGPVEIRLKYSFNNNGILGNAEHPDWLVLKINNGGVNLNSGSKIYGQVIAPSGTVNINGNTLLTGTVRADQLTINSGGELRYTSTSAPPVPLVLTVSLTAPEPNALLQAPALVQLAANATATGPAGAAVTKVEFYATPLTGNGPGTPVHLGEDTSAPYTYAWSNVGAGAYSLTAVATANNAAQATSVPVYITVNGQPSVEVTTSSETGVITAGGSLRITASPADTDGIITKVEFFVDGVKVGESTGAPWTFDWTGTEPGQHVLTVRVTDDRGAVTTSSETLVTVNAPPTVALTAPTANATIQLPASVALTASASDSDGTIAKVEFFALNTGVSSSSPVKLGEATDAPYSHTWAQPEAGTYALTAMATDNHGATATSEAVPFTVQEPAVEWFTLKEEQDFAKKKEYSLTIPAPVQGSPAKTTISFRYKELAFDDTTQTSPLAATRIRDGFELALLGADG